MKDSLFDNKNKIYNIDDSEESLIEVPIEKDNIDAIGKIISKNIELRSWFNHYVNHYDINKKYHDGLLEYLYNKNLI